MAATGIVLFTALVAIDRTLMQLPRACPPFWIELGVVAIGLVTALLAPPLWWRILGPFRSIGRWLARRRLCAAVFSFFLAPTLRVLASPWVRLRYPAIHDEFSYLLLGDTFASGRLTNPTHPFWVHFETIHVIQRPSYASIYPVVQGIFLAIGQVTAHAPWLGVWLSVALFCGALYWMLNAWLPRGWAIAGTTLAAVRFGIFSYWMNSYWGGAPAALGGALVLGALPRIFRYRRMRDAFWLALGIAILANSRPYEGFFFCLPVAAAFLAWAAGRDRLCRGFGFTSRADQKGKRWRLATAVVVGMAVTAAAMGYYFWRVTGNPMKMPYSIEAEQYGIVPLFRWQGLRAAPHYNNGPLRYFFAEWAPTRSSLGQRFFEDWRFYLGPALSMPLLLGAFAFRRKRVRFLLIVTATASLAVAIEWWSQPHYLAPVTSALYALVLEALRQMRVGLARHGAPTSRWGGLVPLVPVVILAMVAARFALFAFSIPAGVDALFDSPTLTRLVSSRSEVEKFLLGRGEKTLVLVRYTNHENSSVHSEWVYNSANIDAQPIVWARELDDKRNRGLKEYYKDRKVWLCSPDERLLVPLD